MGSKKHILKEAFVGALLVASIIVILKHFDLLDRIKIITLNAVSSTVSYSFSNNIAGGEYQNHKTGDLNKENRIEDNTSLLIINQKNYEVNFNQSSPLDRKIIAQYIEKISKSNPEVLAIDLDLSPNPNIEGGNGCLLDYNKLCSKDHDKTLEKNENGDELLFKALKNISERTKVVLLFPEPVESMAVKERKIEWIQNVLECGHGNIHFALGTIFEQDGMSLKYIDAPSNFSKTIYSLYEKSEEYSEYGSYGDNFFIKIIKFIYDFIEDESNSYSSNNDFLINKISKEENVLSHLLNKNLRNEININKVYKDYLEPL